MYQSLSRGLQHYFSQSTTPASAPLKRETNLLSTSLLVAPVLKHLSLRSHGNAALFLVSSSMELNGYTPSQRAVTRYEVAVSGSLSSCSCLRFPQLPPLAFVDCR